jgi:hypothetical protein
MKNISRVLLLISCVIIISACTRQEKKLEITPQDEVLITQYSENIKQSDAYSATDAEKKKVAILEENGSVYYYAADGKRYIFPNQSTYNSWFGGYETDRVVKLEEMQKVPLGGNVTLRPGSLITTESDPRIYLVTHDNLISSVSPAVLKAIYGDAYKQRVIDIENYYFTNYVYGPEIITVDGFPDIEVDLTIDKLKGFVQ